MIYFVRHGESEANVDEVFAGQRDDSPLTHYGASEAKEAGENIKKQGLVIDQIIASPLQRAHKTATEIAKVIGYDVEKIQLDPRIKEYDVGSLTGTTTNIKSIDMIAPDDAEDINHFRERIQSALDDYSKLEGNTLMVSHAGVAKMVESIRTNQPPHMFYDIDGYPNGSITPLSFLE